MNYSFKRDFYFEVKKMLDKTNVVFLLGPRKCGKTVCMLQLNEEYSEAEYVNFKIYNEKEAYDKFDEINEAISSDSKKIFFLDEITYCPSPEIQIYKIADAYTRTANKNTKIIFAGSQSVALDSWGHRAFAGSAGFIRPNFLTYNEWLKYKNTTEISEDTYEQYLYGVSDFYNFTTLEDYLKGCLDETIISNNNTSNYLLGNDCHLIDTGILIDICYATLFTLHNQVNARGFSNADKLTDAIKAYFSDVCRQIGTQQIGELINNSFAKKYTDFHTKDLATIKQALLFLYQCDLITLTPVTDNFEELPNLYYDLWHDTDKINYKEDLFRKYNICIKYPLFYVTILKDILKEYMPEKLPGMLLGSIVECQIRGLLSDDSCIEYHDMNDKEIDYVNLTGKFAMEMTISNKASDKVNFHLLPDDYYKILLTKDILQKKDEFAQIPYYQLIYKFTENKEYDFFSDKEVEANSSLSDMLIYIPEGTKVGAALNNAGDDDKSEDKKETEADSLDENDSSDEVPKRE